MLFRRSDSAKKVDEDWHRIRHEARTTTFSLDEWSSREIIRWDLETAQIDGSGHPLTYTIDRDIDTLDSNGTDIRMLDDR